ncbi:hsp70 nucleotide exchange factor FES1 [Selaginella moellendorffii]|uniref:hsp70 nucleotide exchange factor FES1 n=1 Tax=Selaginella moellendorffii TaxID=88036 RepID=UPI000D1C9BCB|nr:hsp70 nucleotide exchange factor FES1 [Selaginella moellendorffii]|eukprot:XP_024527110.1 hsp70 nucleotide exchange factor FES1 [Selaginella moellendorffii]
MARMAMAMALVCFFSLACGAAAAAAPPTVLSRIAGLDAKLNSSRGGFAWVTGIDEKDLETKAQVSLLEDTEVGFPTLDSLLQWAIGHSDPEKLKDSARETMRLTPEELAKRRADIKELMERLKMPSDADLMRIAIKDLKNSSLSVDEHKRALDELLELVEPIDNANDLNKLGGLEAVIDVLQSPEEDIRVAAAWVLGKASQNNRLVQSQILQMETLPALMKMVTATSEEEAVKALYAVSAVIRNYPAGHEAFYEQGGARLLQELLSSSSTSQRLMKKALFLVADLAEQLAEAGGGLSSYVPEDELVESVVQILGSSDLDTQEKALMALKSLARVGSTHKTLKGVSGLDVALEKLRRTLEQLMLEQDHVELARDMEELRKEVAASLQVGRI